MDSAKKLFMKFIYFNHRLNQWVIFTGCLGLVLLLGTADYLSGFEFSFSLFYLVPVSITAWFINRNLAFFISGISSITWYISNDLAGQNYSHPGIGIWNALVRLTYFGIISLLLTYLKKSIQQERDFSRIDFLTGITNSRAFYSIANLELARAKRYGHPFTLAFVDLDNFKGINDKFGHTEGDRVLKTVAEILKSNLRLMDIAARLGGDEFAIFLPESNSESAILSLNKIRALLIQSMKENHWDVTFSIGVITFHKFSISIDEMIRKADQLMYAVKGNGKDNINFAVEPSSDIKLP